MGECREVLPPPVPLYVQTHCSPKFSERSEVTAPQPLTTFGIRHQHDVVLSCLEAACGLQVLHRAHDGGIQHAVVLVHLLLVADFCGFGEQVLHPIAGVHCAWTATAAAAAAGGESSAVRAEGRKAEQ